MLERYYSKLILCQIFYKRIRIYCLLILVASMFIAFSVLMNIILNVLSATELFCKDSIAKQKRQASIYRNKVFPRSEQFLRHYHRRTCDEVQQQTEKYFDCLETKWSKFLPIGSYSATNDSWTNVIHDEPITTNGNNLFEYDELMNNNVKDNSVFNINDVFNEEQTAKKNRWLWLNNSKKEIKINMAKSKSNKLLKQDNPWNRLDILNKTNELNDEYLNPTKQPTPLNQIYTNTDTLVVKNNIFKKLLRPFKYSQLENIVLPSLNEKISPGNTQKSQTLYTMAQFDFFWPQTLSNEPITHATSEYTPTQMNSSFFWEEKSKQNLLNKQKNDNLKIKETSHNLNNLYRNYFIPKTVTPTLMNSFVNNENKISNLPIDSEFQVPKDIPKDVPMDIPKDVPMDIPKDVPMDIPKDVPKDIPKFPYYTISVDQLERILHRFRTTTRKPLSLINDYSPISYLISNQKLAPQIVKAMRHLDKTVLNYPARVHYDLYKVPSSLEKNIDNQRKTITNMLQPIISAGQFQNNDNYK